ncbi:conserved hypothetical protein [Ricinus communis]|uniref:Uncharacterized protein n=1 Tax=Ricinus communis TaxID=3988 RepID=B9SAQ9_RICCO|nr:conserved hypothetical protein [Ricinus communis]
MRCELTDGSGDLDLERDLQKFQKQPKFKIHTFLFNNFHPRALMPLPRQSYQIQKDKRKSHNL